MLLTTFFASQICHENINKPLGGAYLSDSGIDIKLEVKPKSHEKRKVTNDLKKS